MNLDRKFVNSVRGAILTTWDQIGPDAMPMVDDDNELAMEFVIDADRMSMFAGDPGEAADKLVDEACRAHGYTTVLQFLANEVPLL